MNIFSKFIKRKKANCLLITPPLFAPWSFYLAAPLLVGQLINNGYNAKNLDLNIRFFRTVLSQNYINKTKKILDSKNITYDDGNVDFLFSNLETAISTYEKTQHDEKAFKDAQKLLESVLDFISLPYTSLIKLHINNTQGVYDSEYNYKVIKDISFDKDHNIFIGFFEEIIDEINKQNIDFVGITVPFPDTIIPAFTLARLLKEKTNAHVVLGGVYLKSETVLNYPEIFDIYCDSILIGDGEESIVELVKSFENRQNREKVPSLIYKNKKDKVIFNPIKPITTMGNIADISLEGLDFKEYMAEWPSAPLIISKGCYWGKCNFCDYAPKYKCYSIKSPKKVVANMKQLQEKYQINVFRFQDDAIPPAYLSKLADEIIEQELNIIYHCYCRLEKEFNKELLAKLYKSGLRLAFWGLESGSQKVLDAMNKGIKIDNVHQILKDSHEIGIHNIAGIVINFPSETMDDYNKTFDFLKTIQEYVVIILSDFTVRANSATEKNPEQFGLKIFSGEEFGYSYCFEDINMDSTLKQQKWQTFFDYFKESHSA